MALSFSTVQEAYVVLGELKKEVNKDLIISSWPEDMAQWDDIKKEKPPLNVVLGWDKKHDDGWESLCFFVKEPSKALIDSFLKFNTVKGNTHICKPYYKNTQIWCFGWF